MITLHHLGVSQSERILWLLEELGQPYELIRYTRAASGAAPAEYKALSPTEQAPVIEDGPLRLAESAAIVEYLLATYGNGRLRVHPGEPGYADYLFWFHFGNSSMMPGEMGRLIVSRLGEAAAASDFGKRMIARADHPFTLAERRLAEAAYFAGDQFSAADIMMVFPMTTMRTYTGRDLSCYPNLLAYLARIGARPAYQRAMQAGDPGMTPMLD